MLGHLNNAVAQMLDPAFRRALFISIGAAAVLFAILYALTLLILSGVTFPDWPYAEEAVAVLVSFLFLVVAWLLFPAVSTAVLSLFLDGIVDAVEEKHYPANRAGRDVGWREALASGLKFMAVTIGINILALPLYLLFMFTIFGGTALFIVINSYLLGREYYEQIAIRHFLPPDAAKLRRARRPQFLVAGFVITLMFMVPLLNLIAPLIATAFMVHVFHGTIVKGKKV